MKISVIIVNYNVKYYLEQCLLSVQRALEGIEGEVLVVDNHSSDGSIDYLKPRFPAVHFITSGHNQGFAKANNIAIKQCKGEYVLLLNPDTIVGEEAIRSSLAFMEGHEKAGGLGVMMLTDTGDRALESRRGLPTPRVAFYKMVGLCKHFPTHKSFAHYYMGNLSWDVPGQIEVISGAYCFLRHSALRQIGLLDEDFFMYGEDVDLSYRLLQAGYENWYLPVQILHYKGESTQKSSFRYVHVFYNAMLIFFQKHYDGASRLLTIPIKMAIYARALLSLVGMTHHAIGKMLGFRSRKKYRSPHYIFVGGEEMTARCQQIAADNGLTAESHVAEKARLSNIHDALLADWEGQKETLYIVYDCSLFAFHDILEAFESHPMTLIHMGFYHHSIDKIITSKEIIG